MNYLIVGQGLAGTLIGHRLESAGHRVEFVDAPGQTAASTVAAGIVNPITGRRFVKSWRIEELIPAARGLYAELEDLLGVTIWYDLPLVRALFNRGDENDWFARGGDAAYAAYLIDHPALGTLPDLTAPVHAYAGVGRSARVDVAALVTAYRAHLMKRGTLHDVELSYDTLHPTPEGVEVQGLGYFDRMLFCEGWRARYNPWFANLPHGGAKGEVLIVRIDGPPLDRMFKHRVFLVPQADGTYWVGATNANRFADDSPTPEGRTYLRERLAEVLTVPFEVVDHRAAVRPTVRDRRPLLGVHPDERSLYCFNGLGTKGASLGPLCSQWLFHFLQDGTPLPGEVDIARFGSAAVR